MHQHDSQEKHWLISVESRCCGGVINRLLRRLQISTKLCVQLMMKEYEMDYIYTKNNHPEHISRIHEVFTKIGADYYVCASAGVAVDIGVLG